MDLETESGFCASLFAIKGGLAGIQARRRYPHFSLFREAARCAGSAKKMRGPTRHECAKAAAPKLRLSGWRDSWGVLARALCVIAFCAWGARFFRRTLRALRIFAPAGWGKIEYGGIAQGQGEIRAVRPQRFICSIPHSPRLLRRLQASPWQASCGLRS